MINFVSIVPFKTRVIIYIYIYICFKTQMLFIYCQETRQMLTLEPTNVWILDIYQPITAALTTKHKNGRKLETEVLQKKRSFQCNTRNLTFNQRSATRWISSAQNLPSIC